MKRYKILLSILTILIVISGIAIGTVYAKDIEDEVPKVPKEFLDKEIATDEIPVRIQAVEQKTYTDIWVKSNTTEIPLTIGENYTMTQTINLTFPSTVTVQFNSEMLAHDSIASAKVYIDGRIISPGEVYMASDNHQWQTYSYTFFKSYLATGRHNVKIVVEPNYSRGEDLIPYVILWYKTMIVTANGYGH